MSFDTLVFDPPTEPIQLRPPTSAFTRTTAPSPAVLWVRSHGVYLGLALTVAFTCALSPLPRFETTLAAITTTNAALWLLRKLGGRP